MVGGGTLKVGKVGTVGGTGRLTVGTGTLTVSTGVLSPRGGCSALAGVII
jgi:hypothetical protein